MKPIEIEIEEAALRLAARYQSDPHVYNRVRSRLQRPAFQAAFRQGKLEDGDLIQ